MRNVLKYDGDLTKRRGFDGKCQWRGGSKKGVFGGVPKRGVKFDTRGGSKCDKKCKKSAIFLGFTGSIHLKMFPVTVIFYSTPPTESLCQPAKNKLIMYCLDTRHPPLQWPFTPPSEGLKPPFEGAGSHQNPTFSLSPPSNGALPPFRGCGRGKNSLLRGYNPLLTPSTPPSNPLLPSLTFPHTPLLLPSYPIYFF
jgi:hypothetical protein